MVRKMNVNNIPKNKQIRNSITLLRGHTGDNDYWDFKVLHGKIKEEIIDEEGDECSNHYIASVEIIPQTDMVILLATDHGDLRGHWEELWVFYEGLWRTMPLKIEIY